MKAIEVIEKLKQYADEYKKDSQDSLQRNNHMNEIGSGEKVQQRHIDAVLVDYINFVAMKHGIDYGMYTKDLKK